MKHKKEWHTCDRCGVKIKEVPKDREIYQRYPILRRIINTPKNIKKITCDEYGYISDNDLVKSKIESITIVESSKIKEESIDLCPKCAKDFERFMKNE